MANEIRAFTPTLKWISDILMLFQTQAIKVPEKYRDKVLEVKSLLDDDPSGLANTILDFSINSALVDYRVEVTDNPNLAEILNNWLKNLNSSLIGKIPAPFGLNSLAKEYFRERWKGSSNLLLRTFWEDQDGLYLPTTAFFVAGEDIKVKTPPDEAVVRLGDEKYYLRNGKDESKDIPLPNDKNEMIFLQRPYESWGNRQTVPFLIKRGVYHNSKFLQLLSSKGEFIVGRALEYLFVMRKGSEALFKENITYSREDLERASQDLMELINRKKTEGGLPSYTTNFDTEIEHLIPEYTKAISDSLYGPLEKRILAGLGMMEVVEGFGSTRKESILNPKPLIGEINSGIKDFIGLLNDIIKVIVDKNTASHPKWMNAKIEVHGSAVRAFVDDKLQTFLRSLYDRGALSKRTLVEVAGNLDFDLEVQHRKTEKTEGLEDLMYAPVIQNQGLPIGIAKPNPSKNPTIDKQGPEKKNFNQSWEESKSLNPTFGMICLKCLYEGDLTEFIDNLKHSEVYGKTVSICPGCSEELREEDVSFASIVYEEAPYKTDKDLPEQLKQLPAGAKTIFRKAFNNALQTYNDEKTAFRVAWSAVENVYKKEGEKWVKK